MANEKDAFLIEGLKRYKKATEVCNAFRHDLQEELQSILKTRSEWGVLTPQRTSIKSTTFWQIYPLVNSRITCGCKDNTLILVIAVNWFESETDIPFFSLWIEKGGEFLNSMQEHQWENGIKCKETTLRIDPDENNFDIEGNFNRLLDEFIRYVQTLKFEKDV